MSGFCKVVESISQQMETAFALIFRAVPAKKLCTGGIWKAGNTGFFRLFIFGRIVHLIQCICDECVDVHIGSGELCYPNWCII